MSRYTFSRLTIPHRNQGSYTRTVDGRILRHGKGSLYKLIEEGSVICKVLVYEGDWNCDLPHGEGLFYFFQDEWTYEGSFRNGTFFGKGIIKYIDLEIYSGKWNNFLLEEFLIPETNLTDAFGS